MGYKVVREYVTEIRREEKEMKRLEDWIGVVFESSCYKTPEFLAFARMFRARIKKEASAWGLDLVDFNTGHFDLSGFLKNTHTGGYVYFSIPDVRFDPGAWSRSILVRSAKGPKDYTGGMNNTASLETIGAQLAHFSGGVA